MKVVIIAGGLGTRIGEESSLKPKPILGDSWKSEIKRLGGFGNEKYAILEG